ncbi:MAG: nucleoside triphosphate pyrophosphohydrolase [Ruminococcaceae bacterium]|nr:nucleoside triphosphate pyrophosphohydrolase [Oscillospiraceae bacterium]
MQEKKTYTFEDLLSIIEALRGENGCPWDKVQTHQSVKMNLIEEAYEAVEALDHGTKDQFADELGDLLLQVVFHAQIGKGEGTFSIDDVLWHVCNKMISRHTHIFGEDKADTPEEVLETWEKNKQKEKGQKSATESISGVCAYLPALIRAQKIQSKAAKVGFDWENVTGALDKLSEEVGELSEAIQSRNDEMTFEELGDVLFSAVNVARFAHCSAEEALSNTIRKFVTRFAYVEESALALGKTLEDMTLSEMDALWDEAKSREN